MRSVQKVSSHVIWERETFIEEDTDIRNTALRTMMPQSPSNSAPWDLTQLSQSPSAAPSYFPESHWQFEISSFSKVILVLGKARSHRAQIWAVGGLSHLGDFMFCQKTLQMWWMSGHVVMMKLPITSCPQLWPSESPKYFHRGMFKFNTKFDTHLLLDWLSHSTHAHSMVSTAPTD